MRLRNIYCKVKVRNNQKLIRNELKKKKTPNSLTLLIVYIANKMTVNDSQNLLEFRVNQGDQEKNVR